VNEENAVGIGVLDSSIIVVYLVGIVIIGLWSARKKNMDSNDYFLAGRSLRWPMIGLALFATNISTIHLVGLAGSGCRVGMVYGNFEWMAAGCLILLGLVFAPFYFKNRIATLPDYLERRFSPASRTMLAFMSVVGALFIHIGMSLFAGSKVLETFYGFDVTTSIIVISVVTALYTITGGLKAVVVTEAIQTVVLLIGAVIVTVLAVMALPEHGISSYAALKEVVTPERLSMIHTHEGAELPWYAMLLGYPIIGIWYWCADQTIVQRVLGAKTKEDAQIGPVFAGFIKILPVFLMVFPGVCAYALFHEEIGKDYDTALPMLINKLVPIGLKGIISAGLLAALMSTIAGALNSASTLISIDIVKRLKPETKDRTLISVGRISACIVMVLAMLWSTQGNRFEDIFSGINSMICCLAPAITTVFLFGIFWRRGTQEASLITLMSGLILGVTTFALDFFPIINAEKLFVTNVLGIPFMMQAWWLFCICSFIFVIVSWMTPMPMPEQITSLCWKNPLAALTQDKFQGAKDVRLQSGILAVVMAIMYYIFA
jgi:solute:Na+ symporter, SSS family